MIKRPIVALALVALFAFPSSASAGLLGDFFSRVLAVLTQLDLPQNISATGQLSAAAAASAGATNDEEKEIRSLTGTLVHLTGAESQGSLDVPNQVELDLAKKRGIFMQRMAEQNPTIFLRNTLPPGLRAKLSTASQQEVEEAVSLTGKLDVLHIDDFNDSKNSRFEYHLQTGGKRLSLLLVGEKPALSSGTLVNVKGYRIGKTIVAAGDAAGLTVVDASEPESVGVQNTLIVLITTPGRPSTPTKGEMHNTIFSGNFAKFYSEQSYGKTQFVGDVTDWISIPASSNPSCGTPLLDQLEVKNYILQKGISLANYDRVMFVVNGWYGGCAYVGKSDWPFNGSSYHLSLGWTGWPDDPWEKKNMSGFDYVLTHEMGHELGVAHANFWYCYGPSLDSNCFHYEYGNHFDAMGTGMYSEHFNAFYKDFLGWFSASDKVEVTHAGRYSLSPLETLGGVKAAVIRNPALPSLATSPTYIEFRRPIGFDSLISPLSAGLHINQVVRPENAALPMTRLLNAQYAISPESQPALMPGGTFSWPSRGFSIDSVVFASSTASFGVKMRTPQCVRHDVVLADMSERLAVSAGAAGWVQFRLTNADDPVCRSSEFSLRASLATPEGWYLDHYPSSQTPFVLSAGQSAYTNVVFMPPFDAIATTQTVTITITDHTNDRVTELSRQITVVPPPHINGVVPASGEVNTNISLSGSGFASGSNTNGVFITMSGTTTPIFANVMSTYAPNDTRLDFDFPATVTSVRGDSYENVPTPYGEYQLQVNNYYTGGQSNFMPFTVSPPPPTNLSCTLAGVTVPHSESRAFYSKATLPYGSLCTSYDLERTCTNGELSGSDAYSYATCSVSAPKSCTLAGVTVAHGKTRRFYQYLKSTDCVTFSRIRTCNNGVLSGNTIFNKATCTK